MADVFDRKKRSQVMSQIRSRGNRDTELRLISLFKEFSIKGWRRSYALLGKPDFVFPRLGVAIFVDGCFWHGCSKHSKPPKTNVAYWSAKIARNKARDSLVMRSLRKDGWRVMRIWEHSLSAQSSGRTMRRIKRVIDQRHLEVELKL